MTRHTRNRQMKKLCKDRSLHGMYFKGSNTDIEGNIRVYKEFGDIDPDFEWHRYSVYKSDKLYNVVSMKSDRPWRKWIPVKEMK